MHRMKTEEGQTFIASRIILQRGRLRKKRRRQGAQGLRSEAFGDVRRSDEGEAQRSIRAFSEAGQRGFTLLEVIIVMALITLVLGLASVHFAGYLPSAKLDATGRELSALIRQARSLARMNRETERVVIDLDGRTYGIEKRGMQNFPLHVLVRIIDPFAGEISRGKYFFVFHPAGGMEGGAIVLSGGKKVIRIDLDPLTGAALLK